MEERISTAAALSQVLVQWQQLDWPICWEEIFGRNAPMIVEIGFGNDPHLLDRAEADPETNHLGIELAWGPCKQFVRRTLRRGVTNVRAIHGDANIAIRHLFPAESIEHLYVLNSDPWPKDRHHGRRLIQQPFLRFAAAALKPETQITIATDHQAYAEWIGEQLEKQSRLTSIHDTTSVPEVPGLPKTRYAEKGISAGQPMHYFEWSRTGSPDYLTPQMRINDMPNATLAGAVPFDSLFDGIKPDTWTETVVDEDVHLKLFGAYRHHTRNEWLAEMLVSEGALTQHFGVIVVQREDDRITLKLSSMGVPRPTEGTKRAVRKLAELMLAAHPKLAVVSNTVDLKAQDS